MNFLTPLNGTPHPRPAAWLLPVGRVASAARGEETPVGDSGEARRERVPFTSDLYLAYYPCYKRKKRR